MQAAKWLLLMLIVFSACSHGEKASNPDMKFDRALWDMKEDRNYDYRKQMIYDLLNNYNWPGLTKDSVQKMLGEPDVMEEDIFMLYHYNQKFVGSMVWSTQSMVVQLDSNSRVVLARTN